MGADEQHLRRQVGLDDYSTIRCVNYIRSEVSAKRDPRPALAAAAQGGAAGGPKPWDGDQYMKPVLDDDPLLFYEYDDVQATCAPCHALKLERTHLRCTVVSGLQSGPCRLGWVTGVGRHSAACLGFSRV